VPAEPEVGCGLCPRLAQFRRANSVAYPDFCNQPVPSFGDAGARLLVVGLAPGLKGANRTGRPFTGDYAGDLLYQTLLDFGFAGGSYRADPNDGLQLKGCMITNAVRCVPPQNKPTGQEAATCRQFLAAQIAALPKLRVIVALGRISHDNVLSALGARRAGCKFAHGAVHLIGDDRTLIDSYHCSRYNTNTGVLTTEMFRAVFAKARDLLAA
jgi:uracil-DNA glycosylase